ncbi:hypothetical protein DY000_02022937 [Brassica cretica]|uniref:Uncharacterized protein n=1 Tax=Brassica cretica TaxID=69181 RepID=A0ABQ7EMB3_BRACR|nr:hypothetical protein DY000_02022937 [Brassica cretica]
MLINWEPAHGSFRRMYVGGAANANGYKSPSATRLWCLRYRDMSRTPALRDHS